MQILYAVTFRAPNNTISGLLHKIKLTAGCQVEALSRASEKAAIQGWEVVKVEELEVLNSGNLAHIAHSESENNLLSC